MSHQLLLQSTPVMYRALLRELLQDNQAVRSLPQPLDEVYYFSETGERRHDTHALAGDLYRINQTQGIAIIQSSETDAWIDELTTQHHVLRRAFRRVAKCDALGSGEEWSEEEAFARAIASRCQRRVGILAQPYQILRAYVGVLTILCQRKWHENISLYAITPAVPDHREHPLLVDLLQDEIERFTRMIREYGYSPALALEYLGQRYAQDADAKEQRLAW